MNATAHMHAVRHRQGSRTSRIAVKGARRDRDRFVGQEILFLRTKPTNPKLPGLTDGGAAPSRSDRITKPAHAAWACRREVPRRQEKRGLANELASPRPENDEGSLVP